MVDPSFKILAILLTLNKDTVAGPVASESASGENDISQLLDCPKLVKGRLICHLGNEEDLGTKVAIETVSNVEAVLNAMVYIGRILQWALVNIVTSC